LPEQLIDAETAEKMDLRRLEESLQSLWEKARLVSDLLLRLKTENKELQSKLSSLELKERRWAEELRQREQRNGRSSCAACTCAIKWQQSLFKGGVRSTQITAEGIDCENQFPFIKQNRR